MPIGHSGRARRPLRAGIIGTGFMGGVHARAVRSAGHLVSRVAGSNPATAAAAADRLGATASAASVEELIDSAEVDVVHVCTPNATHADFAERALAAGKAVVCEKPLATSAAEAERLTGLAARAGAVAAVPFVYRFYPTVREVRSRVAAGEAGSLWLLHGSYLQDWLAGAGESNWRVDPALAYTSPDSPLFLRGGAAALEAREGARLELAHEGDVVETVKDYVSNMMSKPREGR